MILHVFEICGDDIISRDSGRKIRDLLLAHWNEEKIEIFFDGKTVASVSFFDEAIGLLMKKEGKTVSEIRKKLKFPDLTPEDRTLLNYIFATRVNELENKTTT